MARLFDEYKVRRVQSLDGAWKFRTDGNNVGIESGWNRYPTASTPHSAASAKSAVATGIHRERNVPFSTRTDC